MAAWFSTCCGNAHRAGLPFHVIRSYGLRGVDLELEFTADPSAAGGQPPAVSDTNLPSMFTALEEQLGLKLVPERRPVEVLVIDRVERPTDN